MLSRTEAVLLKEALNRERGVMDGSVGRIIRARVTYGASNDHVGQYTDAAAAKLAEASSIVQKLIESLDSFLRQ